jgi:hypothetical protein
VFQYFRPGFDLDAERQARLDAGLGEYLNGHDLLGTNDLRAH